MVDAIRALAVHESGHAAAAFVLGLPINDVVVQARDDGRKLSGYVGAYHSGRHVSANDIPVEKPGAAPPWANTSFRAFLPQAIVAAAGPAAQDRVGGGFEGSEGDERRIQHLANLTHYASGRDPEAWKRMTRMIALRLLASPTVWGGVVNLSDALARGLRIELLKFESDGQAGLVEFVVPAAGAERLLTEGGARRGIVEHWGHCDANKNL
ncbi:MAG: hypothetical protein ACR650_00165 [Methylocystis sp.]